MVTGRHFSCWAKIFRNFYLIVWYPNRKLQFSKGFSQIVCHLIQTTALRGRYYLIHFRDKEPGAQSIKWISQYPKSELAASRCKLRSPDSGGQVLCVTPLCFYQNKNVTDFVKAGMLTEGQNCLHPAANGLCRGIRVPTRVSSVSGSKGQPRASSPVEGNDVRTAARRRFGRRQLESYPGDTVTRKDACARRVHFGDWLGREHWKCKASLLKCPQKGCNRPPSVVHGPLRYRLTTHLIFSRTDDNSPVPFQTGRLVSLLTPWR